MLIPGALISLNWLGAPILGFLAALVLTPVMRRLAVRWRILDLPVGGKIHTRATPLMGGVAVYLAFALATATWLPATVPVIGVLAGGLAAVAVGVADERFNLSPLVHLGGQVTAAAVTIVCGVGYVGSISLPFAAFTTPAYTLPAWIGIVFTVFWLVGMMNAVNFVDGLDGLATGVAALAALLLAVWAVEAHQRFFVPPMAHQQDLVLPLALAGALLGFLPYNWHQARIFLGDSGSMFLGLALGALSIVGPAKLGTALLVLIIPVLDVAWAIVRRQLTGRSFLSGDKQHVYHRMLQLGLSHRSTVLLLYFLCLSLAGLDLLLTKVAKLVAFLVLAAATWGTFVVLEIRAQRAGRARVSGRQEGVSNVRD